MLWITLLCAAAAATLAAPPAAIIFSAGFTDHAILQAAPARAAIYGFATPAAPGEAPLVTLTLTRADGSTAAVVPAAAASAGAGNTCDGACYAAGFLSGVGTTSCCQATTCPQGCAIASVVDSLAACKSQCASAAGHCSYTVPNTSVSLDECEGCLAGCPGKGECEAGCALFFGAGAQPAAWKALLPPQAAGGDFAVTAACSNCAAGAAPAAALAHVAFGSVFYCSGQSNAALGMQYTYSYEDVVAEVQAGTLDDLRVFQFGGMGSANGAESPVFATTALTYPSWSWANLSAALAIKDSPQALGNVPATCLYFIYYLKKSGSVPGPLGVITNAVGGTTIAAWSDPRDLAACPNSTDTASADPPLVLYNGMAAPLMNTTVAGFVWCAFAASACGAPASLAPLASSPRPFSPRPPFAPS